jgi:hypothetical protein
MSPLDTMRRGLRGKAPPKAEPKGYPSAAIFARAALAR